MSITRSRNPVVFTYRMNGVPLEHVGSFKDLGVVFDSKLCFNEHIDSLISKCNQINGLIKRSVGYHAPSHVKLQLYKSLTLSNMDYCSQVWSPQGFVKIRSLESVQRSMTKYILNDFDASYVDRCSELDLMPLTYRRECNDLLYLFKVIHGLLEVNLSEEVEIVHRESRTMQGILLQPTQIRTETFYSSFFNRVVYLWNVLPLQIREAQSLHVFRGLLISYYSAKL
jgi:hypothetical protein